MAHTEEIEQEGWYKYGIAFLYIEMAIAIQVTLIALYMTLTGITVDIFLLLTSIIGVTGSIVIIVITVLIIRGKMNE